MTTTPPRRPSPKGPNPFLLLGLFAAASSTFLILVDRRNSDPTHKRREFHGPLLPPLNAEKVELPDRRPVEG
jgi:hypothetical protein